MKTWLLPLVLFSTSAFAEPSAYELQARAYANYLNEQYNAGKITKAQMDYMTGLKDSEMRTRAAAAEQKTRNAQLLREAKENQKLNKQPLNCAPSQTDPWGRMNCR